MPIFCVKCKSKTADSGKPTMKTTKNGRRMMTTKCSVCGTTKNQFVAGGKGGALFLPK